MFKIWLRRILVRLPFKVTQNIYYDHLSSKIIRQVCSKDSNCIDIGCLKGEVMDEILSIALLGSHIAIEPLPEYAALLRLKYKSKNVDVVEKAMSQVTGMASFNYVTSNPSYSGLLKRHYDKEESDTSISVETDLLDNVVDSSVSYDLIKIDVEGGELAVLQGGINTINKDRPVIIFEHGKGGADVYGVKPGDISSFFESVNYEIYTLKGFLKKKIALNSLRLDQLFQTGKEFYFVAVPKK